MDSDYREAAHRYIPSKIEALLIAESPPAYAAESKKSYFYFEQNPGSDVLFASVVAALFSEHYRKSPAHKNRLLRRMQAAGYWLTDAVEHPINRIDGRKTTDAERGEIILCRIPRLLKLLDSLRRRGVISSQTSVILTKTVVFEVRVEDLRGAAYRVPQDGPIPSPPAIGVRVRQPG